MLVCMRSASERLTRLALKPWPSQGAMLIPSTCLEEYGSMNLWGGGGPKA